MRVRVFPKGISPKVSVTGVWTRLLRCHCLAHLPLRRGVENLEVPTSVKLIKVKLTTVVGGNPKVSFSIATTPRCRGGRYSFPWITLLTLDPYLMMLRCQARKYKVPFFKSLVWLDLVLNPGLPGPWRTFYPFDNSQKKYISDFIWLTHWF